MPESKILRRNVGSIDFEAGATKTLDLPRDHYYQALNLTGDYDITVNTASTKKGYGLLELIDNIQVIYNGSTTIKSLSLAQAFWLSAYRRGTPPYWQDLDYSSASQQTGNFGTTIDFLLAPYHFSGLMPAFNFSDLTLKVTWATGSSVADASVNDASLTVQTEERRRDAVAVDHSKLAPFKETEITRTLDSTGEKQIQLPRGNAYYALSVQTLDDNTPDASIYEDAEVKQNTVETHMQGTPQQFRATDKLQYGLESLAPGMFLLNYGFRGNTRDVVRTQDFDSYDLTLDVDTAPTNPSEVSVVTQQLITD